MELKHQVTFKLGLRTGRNRVPIFQSWTLEFPKKKLEIFSMLESGIGKIGIWNFQFGM